MTPFDRSVAGLLESLDAAEPGDLHERTLARVRASGQRPAWAARADLAVGRAVPAALPRGAVATVVVVAALLVVVALGLLAGARVIDRTTLVGPTTAPIPVASAPASIGLPDVSGTWRPLSAPRMPSAGLTATALVDGRVLVAGPVAVLFDPATGTWTQADPPRVPRREAAAARLADGRVLLVGGVTDAASTALDSAELFDPSTGHWSAAGTMSIARAAGHTATTLLDGRVLVAAGTQLEIGAQLNTATLVAAASADLFDPRTGAWTATGELIKAREGHTATLLDDGRVLVTGGRLIHNLAMLDAELFDPRTGTWSAAAPMSAERYEHVAAPLADGSVLVAGGHLGLASDGPSASAERYDPATDSWSRAGTLAVGRYRATATRLPDGTVLVAGGVDPAGPTSTAERYVPAVNGWTATGPMGVARAGQAAVVLENGWALLIGGGPTSTTTATNGVERFFPERP